MDPTATIVVIVSAGVILALAVFLVLRRSGGSFTARGKHGETELEISAESREPDAAPGGRIAIRRAESRGGSIEAATGQGGQIEVEDAAAQQDIRASTSGSEPPPKK